MRKQATALLLVLMMLLATAVMAQDNGSDLNAVKTYTLENAADMQAATTQFLATAEAYYSLLESYTFDYEAAWAAEAAALAALVEQARADWLEASLYYERNEGIVAGVPTLSYYDVLIDAGPAAANDPENALEWTLTLPDATTLDSPGNLFHSLSEPTLYATHDDYIGLAVDLNGDGEQTFTEGLPDANLLLGIVQRLDEETANLTAALEAWSPTLEDAFTALVVMIPTMNEYFGQWKDSAYIAGETAEEASFVAVSRLFDILGILNGLDVVYMNVSPLVSAGDEELDAQITTGFTELVTFVDALYTDEQNAVIFGAEEVDFLGEEAQLRAETLAALVAQAAENAGIELVLE